MYSETSLLGDKEKKKKIRICTKLFESLARRACARAYIPFYTCNEAEFPMDKRGCRVPHTFSSYFHWRRPSRPGGATQHGRNFFLPPCMGVFRGSDRSGMDSSGEERRSNYGSGSGIHKHPNVCQPAPSSPPAGCVVCAAARLADCG
jgi:hypothetical protein